MRENIHVPIPEVQTLGIAATFVIQTPARVLLQAYAA